MEQTREEAPGAPGAPKWPQKRLSGSKPLSNSRHNAKATQFEPQEPRKQSRDDSSHLIAASHGGQTPIEAASSFDSPEGANPVSAASHASAAFLNSSGAQPRPPSFALPLVANGQPHYGAQLKSNHGQQHTSAVPAPQKASVASSCDAQRAVASVGAAQPMSVIANGTHPRPPNPAADKHSGTLAPQTGHPVAKHSTQAASSADAFKSLPSLITSAPPVNGRPGSNSNRQPGSSGDDLHGSTTRQSPIGQLSAESPPVSKPILKMKRTGQNFPLSSPRSPLRAPASLHQRKAPSPNRKTASVPQGSINLSKAPESPQSSVLGLPTVVNGPEIGEKKGLNSSIQLSTNSIENSTRGRPIDESTVKQKAPLDGLSKPASSPIGSKIEATSAESLSMGQTTESVPRSAHVLDETSDDDIKYETAPKTVISDDALEAGMEDDTSEDDTGSGGDDGEALESTSSRGAGASPRQLFHPPEESDYGDETDDDDGTVSSSSSSESSPAADEEPMVALPSANIQHQQDYPEHILKTAKSGRPYHAWFEGKISFDKSGGALFPDGYQRCAEIPGYSWICAVRSCRQVYKTHFGLGNHFKMTHKRFMLNDNLDGTLSVVGSYNKRSQPGTCFPVVVSRRPLDPKEPPMVEPTEPTGKGRHAPTAFRTKAESESEDVDADNLVTGDIDVPARPAVPPKVIQSGNADEMWKYIRPFLTKHQDSIPVLNWVCHVIHLPRVRDIKWNEPRIKDLPYHDSHPRDITALIVQVTGVEAPTPCTACLQGRGPFEGCIMISPQASQESRDHVLACANCYYHCGQSSCSHCSGLVSRRRDRHERLTHKKKIYNVKVLSDRARGAVKAPKTGQQQQQSRTTGDNSLEEASQLNGRVYQPSEIHSLEMASKDRAYKVITGKDGESISMCGALIPEGYDLDRAVPGRPWVCPIRSCRAVFKKIAGLGSHFSVKHRGELLNDNQDGTLSIVGAYNRPLPGHNHCASMVISQNPLDKNEPPMAASKVPGYVRVDSTNAKPQPQPPNHTASVPSRPAQATQMNGVGPPNSDTHSEAKRIWNYILPFLPLSLDPDIFDTEVVRLFALPLLQSVQWRKTWMKRRLDNDRSQIFGILVHVLGVDRKTGSGEKPCSLCTRGEGPFEGCWTLSKDAAWESHKSAMCCANCLFNHKKSQCSVKYGWERRCDKKPGEKTFTGSPPPVGEWAASAAAASASSSGQSKKRQLSASDINDQSRAQRRRYERNEGADNQEQAEVGKKLVPLPLPSPKRNTRASDSPTRRNTSPEPQTAHSISFPSMSSSALVMAGQQTSDELLEMEDWEIAPGRIREEDVDQPNNIAFSKPYLENNQSIPVAADVSFRVETIKSGHKLEFEAITSRARYCSVASGKLRVSIAGQPEFVIGPHGVFKIKPGVKAWAQNRLYVDSVVHVVSVEDGA